MFPELSLCVDGQESKYPFSVNAYESEYSKFHESGNINESGKISSSVISSTVQGLEIKVVLIYLAGGQGISSNATNAIYTSRIAAIQSSTGSLL